MKLIITIFLLFSTILSYGMHSERETILDGNPVIVFVAKNNVSRSISVHTYKLTKKINTEKVEDRDGQTEHSKDIQLIIDTFLSIEGVTRCTFDRATQSFTILTSPTTILSHVEEIINKN